MAVERKFKQKNG